VSGVAQHLFDGSFSIGLYFLASLPFFLDFIDLLLRLYLRRARTVPLRATETAATSVPLEVGQFTSHEMRLHLRPYAIVLSVHNVAEEIDGLLAKMAVYRDRLWFIDDASTDDTWARLTAAGVHCVRGAPNRQKPGALKVLLGSLPADICTVVVLDPDSRIVTSLREFEEVLFQFQRTGMAAFCPRIGVRHEGWLTRIQALEYWLAFTLGRKSLADFSVTSGIAVYRRDALQQVLQRHTLSVYAEDLENSLILLSLGERIYYDGRVVIDTEGMPTVRRLFSQRVGWHFGLMRVYVEHWRAVARCSRRSFGFGYQFVVYLGLFVLAFHPLKIVALILVALSALNGLDALTGGNLVVDTTLTSPLYFIGVYIKYTGLVLGEIPLAVSKGSRRSMLAIVPIYTLYSLAQIVPATVGYANWLSLRLWGSRVYRDHYEPASS
jgi:cellulose synthase/poly-beta-1,6-N-acetylglucosamine synthase-like glycosyltransferase